jgi:hypothetical protein
MDQRVASYRTTSIENPVNKKVTLRPTEQEKSNRRRKEGNANQMAQAVPVAFGHCAYRPAACGPASPE